MMDATTIMEILDAAHLTSYIKSDFEQRGALFLVGPPGNFKTTFLNLAMREYPAALKLSDLNVNSLMSMREQLISGKYTTIYFPEYEKLYARKAETSSNVEATIKQLIEEGFTKASFEEQDAITFTSRSLVLGAMTYQFYSDRIKTWSSSGFKRRILWVGYKLRNPDKIMEAIRDWKMIEFTDSVVRKFPTGSIPYNVTAQESLMIEAMLRGQWEATPYVLLKKMYSVLKWKYKGNNKRPREIFEDFTESLNNNLAVVDL